MPPLLSVIIPAYNRAHLIGSALDSVLAQDTELQVIVVDDGSSDGTVGVVQRYGSRVQLLCQKNKGPGAARNAGLQVAIGRYAAFLDSDDMWFPWTAQIYSQVIEKHGQVAFIAGKEFVFETDADSLPRQPAEVQTREFADYFTCGDVWGWYGASSFVMDRQLLLAGGGFTDEWVNGEDIDAALRMGVAGKFVQVLSPATFAYRRHADSAMANLDRTFAGIRRMILEEKSGRYPGGSRHARQRAGIIAANARPLALELLRTKDRRFAWELYRKTFGWNVSLRRWKFVLGFPWVALIGRGSHGKRP